MIDWTQERVNKLTLQEVRNLRENATSRGVSEVVALCNTRLAGTARRRAPANARGHAAIPKDADAATILSLLAPRSRLKCGDALVQAGLTDIRNDRAFLSQWSWRESSTTVIALWHENMEVEGGRVRSSVAVREVLGRVTNPSAKRYLKAFDADLRNAFARNLPVRVIVVAGVRRHEQIQPVPSKIERRLVDPAPWRVKSISPTGIIRLARDV